MELPADIPAEVAGILREAGYLEEDRLKAGDSIPELTAFTMEGAPIPLASLWLGRPAALIFGSYT